MKCPHCEYENGYNSCDQKIVEGSEGDFFTMSNEVRMERESYSYYRSKDTRTLFGCPSCRKIFMAE